MDEKEKEKKALKMTSQLVIFRAFFHFQSYFFVLISPELVKETRSLY